MSRKNEIDKLIKQLRRRGVSVEPSGSGHWRVTTGEATITMASSPGGRYTLNVIKRDLRKYLNIDI